MIELKEYQERAVNSLLTQTRKLLASPGSDKALVFKSPTGSGKTLMMAEFLKRMQLEDNGQEYVYVWASLYDLHLQSKNKVSTYLEDTSFRSMTLEQLGDRPLQGNTLLFVNWHSLTTTRSDAAGARDWSNVYVKPREDGRSIIEVLEKTRESGKEIILIVDEAHRNYLTENSQRFISEAFLPKLTIEVSATPLIRVDAEDVDAKRKGFVGVPFEEVVQSGLIKQETTINQQIGKFLDLAQSADDIVVQAALAKREELKNLYSSLGIKVNPLVLIQLPSETKETSALDFSVREAIEEQLATRGITYSNGKLAVWLSGEQQNKELLEKNTSGVEVLIFKEAIAVGWDCPRAQILVMLRAIKSVTFEIQTVGRILRMPEAHHYNHEELNKAFVYTNIPSINITTKPEELEFFKTKYSMIRPGVRNVNLPSSKVHRQDYGDLTASFVGVLVNTLNTRFGIDDADTVNSAYEKADKYLELYPDELQRPLISDVIVRNLDLIRSELGALTFPTVNAQVSVANIQREFDHLLKLWCLPFAPVRSFSKIKTGLYKWFGVIGFDSSRWDKVQRIIACSESNQQVLTEAIESAKSAYAKSKSYELSTRKGYSESIFSIPASDFFGEVYEMVPRSKYSHQPCFLRVDRSQPERLFEEALDSSTLVEWWYKNGEAQQKYFSIVYQGIDEATGLARYATFYPDFIVRFTDESIGIFDTKSGRTLTERSTYDKSNALHSYIESNKNLGLQGGIVRFSSEGLFVFLGQAYTPAQESWSRLDL